MEKNKIQSDAERILAMFNVQEEKENDSKFYSEVFEKYGIDINELNNRFLNEQHLHSVDLGFELIHEDAKAPKYNFEKDSGFDLYSVEEYTIPPFGRVLVSTGLKLNLPSNSEIQVRSKSGLAINQGLMVLNSPGTVDEGYKGEIKVIIFNTNNHEFVINKGMKVAQAVLCPVINGELVNLFHQKVDSKSSDRKDAGFGSTGI